MEYTGDINFDRQIAEIIETHRDPLREIRRLGDNRGFTTPVGAVAIAVNKIERVCASSEWRFEIIETRSTAEEFREAAHYLLQAASLIEARKGETA